MSDGPVVITLRDVYDIAVETKNAITGIPSQVADHEQRIRALEKRVWGWTAVSGGGGGLIGSVVTWLLTGGGQS